MNKSGLLLVLLLFVMLQISSSLGSVAPPVIKELVLETNSSQVIEGYSHLVDGGLLLDGNSSLTLNNMVITFADIENAEYTMSGNSRLTAINCSSILESPQSIQASQNASIELINEDFYSTY